MTSSAAFELSASHRAFRTGERRDSWSGEPSGTSISSRQKARLECGFQQGGGAVSFVTRERHSLLPRHPFLEFLPPRLPCLALLAWLSSCWYLHPIVAPTTFVSSSSFSLFLSLSFFLCFSLRLRPPSSAAPPGMLRLNSAPLAATAPRWPCCHPSVCTRPRMAIAEKARNDTATPPFCRDQASRLHRVVRGGEAR